MPNQQIEIAEVFKPLFLGNSLDYILNAGRNAGKSKTAYILVGLHTATNPDEDIVVARASYGSIKDSAYNEIQEVLENIEAFEGEFIFRTSPLRIIRKNTGATIYFMGVGGSKDRTKGIKPLHKVGMLVLEEAQELKSREHYDQTLASLRRRFGKDCKVITIFNPPAQELHWINVWAKEKEKEKDYCVIHSSFYDILPFLSDRDIYEILKIKAENKTYFDYMYMGIPTGSFGCCYPMFRREFHVISPKDFSSFLEKTGVRIKAVVIGGDGAITHDTTAFVPKLILSNGQSVNGWLFIHNPQENGVIGYHTLVVDYLTKWLNDICKMYRLGTVDEALECKRRGLPIEMIPIYMRVDSAAPDLIRECQMFLSNRVDVLPIHKGTIIEMVGVCQSAIANNCEYIIDYGYYHNYYTNRDIQTEVNPLAEQISMLAWNDKQTGYDPIIPNDICDAWTYGTFFWYKNEENIAFFDILKAKSIQSIKISDILKK